jgi:tRNA U55 pseudouridine synthase TruB
VAFGPFTVAQAVPLGEMPPTLHPDQPFLLSLRAALCDYREVEVETETARRLRQGQQQILERLDLGGSEGETVYMTTEKDQSVALARQEQGRWRLIRIL